MRSNLLYWIFPLFLLDKYTKIEGLWHVYRKNHKYHSTFLKAKRYCTTAGNCFGIGISSVSGVIVTFDFPVSLLKGGVFNVHKKEIISAVCFSLQAVNQMKIVYRVLNVSRSIVTILLVVVISLTYVEKVINKRK